jgi:hypothetical protein
MRAYNRAEEKTEARAEKTRTRGGPRLEDRPTREELSEQYARMIAYNARHFRRA